MRKEFLLKSVLFLFCFFLFVTAFAQNGTVSGTITGKEGPLAGATVSAGGKITVTTAEGKFSLSLKPGNYKLAVSYVGYQLSEKSITVKANETGTLDIVMEQGASLSEIVLLGSRSKLPRTNTQTVAPVDIISAADLMVTGQTEPTQMINVIAPSFNSARQTVADGTDHIDPATLRGLGPDQVLVLMNGKRRHNTALININGTVGRGSVGTDLNSIPVSSIDHIEVLRDGAASQYGSDAIAGVINVVLKKNLGTTFTSQLGQQYKGDGEVAQLGLNHGFKMKNEKSYLNLSVDLRYRGKTNRAGDYTGPVYVRWDNDNNLASRQTKYDQDRALIAQNNFSLKENMLVGNAKLYNVGGILNGGISINNKADFYYSAGAGYRRGDAAGFYRYPFQTTQVIVAKYPNGFLPIIGSTIWDKSAQAGIKFDAGLWNWDISNTYGDNSFHFDVKNSNNASQFASGASAQSEFDAGKLFFGQNTFNADVSRNFAEKNNISLNAAFGGEWRTDFYKITAGEEASWKNYDPNSGKVGGAQVFPGFQPANAVNENRTVIALYSDFEMEIEKKLLLNFAGRFENYNDFGSNFAGKLAFRYKLNKALAIRGALSNGFRAPSIHQRYFSAVSTQFVNVNGQLTPRQVGTFRNDGDVARAFGIPALDAEKSKNASLGFTVKASSKFSLTVDGYFIGIDDRIVYTSQFSRSNATVNTLLAAYPDVNAAQFFTNAVNTETKGIDVVTSYRPKIGKKATLDITLAGNYNRTYVVGTVKGTDKVPADQFGNVLFSRQERSRLEESQPKSKITLSGNYKINKVGVMLRLTHYGEVATKDGSNPLLDEDFSSKLITDLSFTWKIKSNFSATVGANNLLNTYPDKLKHIAYPVRDNVSPALDNSSFGRFVYSRNATQFGFNGGYYYLNLSLSL